MPSFLPATRRLQFSKGLGILSYTAGTGFAFKHPGATPDLLIKNQTLYLELMQSTRTCSPVAPSGFRPDEIQHAQISFTLRATQATFKSTSTGKPETAHYRNGNRSKPQSLELITLPSSSKLVWLACKASGATPTWNLPLTVSTEADTGRPKTPIHFRGPYPDVPSIALQPLAETADDPSRGDAAVRKWTGVAPSAVMQTYPLSPP